jgi:hypothetical protein
LFRGWRVKDGQTSIAIVSAGFHRPGRIERGLDERCREIGVRVAMAD